MIARTITASTIQNQRSETLIGEKIAPSSQSLTKFLGSHIFGKFMVEVADNPVLRSSKLGVRHSSGKLVRRAVDDVDRMLHRLVAVGRLETQSYDANIDEQPWIEELG